MTLIREFAAIDPSKATDEDARTVQEWLNWTKTCVTGSRFPFGMEFLISTHARLGMGMDPRFVPTKNICQMILEHWIQARITPKDPT